MKKYKIPVTWEEYGYIEIEAESLEDAIKIAEDDDTPLPEESSYVDGSLYADVDRVYDWYGGE